MMADIGFLKNQPWRHLIVSLILLFCYNSVNAQITADFTSDAVPCGSAVVNFAATVTGTYSLSDLRFDWNMGDGKPGKTGQNVSNGYPIAPGAIHLVGGVETAFTVVLTVTRISTNTVVATQTHDVFVKPAPIPALMDAVSPLKPFDNCASNPTIQNPFYTIVVSNQSQDINLITGYTIDWGDGSTVSSYVNSDFKPTISHLYSKLGLFKLKFTATGVNGCIKSVTYDVKNQGNPAIGISSGGNTTGCAPITFGFRVNRVSKNDAGTTYIWDFGDGTPPPDLDTGFNQHE